MIDPTINDPAVASDERVNALKGIVTRGGLANMPASCGEINNHIHTIYSFSPYTPAMAAVKAKEAGLEVAGSVDHDSYAAAAEMRQACDLLGLGCVTGFELRVSLKHTEFGARKLNSPDSIGIAYMTVQGIPAGAAERVHEFLKPINAARGKRNAVMVEKLNGITSSFGIAPLDYARDVLPLSMAAQGGSVTERHILYALAFALVNKTGKGAALLSFLKEKLSLSVSAKVEAMLSDVDNRHYMYDLLGLLKSSFGERSYIQPGDDECPRAETVTAFAKSINAVPFYAYLGDVGESPTGDKKAEKFEDDFLDDLMPRLKEWGYLGVTYMPPRNTREQLLRLRGLCEKHGLMELCGVDINSSRQTFNCPEIRQPEFAPLIETTWALAAHEKLASTSAHEGLFNPDNPLAAKPLAERIAVYAKKGREV